METLHFRFEQGHVNIMRPSVLVGVVSSGNLEVFMESTPLDGACTIEVNTSATGFSTIWKAVMNDFHQRWQLCNVRIAINDVGATPAVVALRLNQAVESINEPFAN